MKKFVLLLTAALAFAAISCTPDNPDDPGKDNGKDQKEKALTTLVSNSSSWSVDKRLFDLSFSGEDLTLSTELVGFDANLAAGKYTLKAEASAQAGDGVLEKTLLNSKAVSAGSVTVAKTGNKYTFTFALTADGEEVSLSWSGDVTWTADPAAKKTFSVVLSANANQVSVDNVPVEGQFTLSMNLAVAGISQEFDMTTYQNVWKGEGEYLAIDIYSTDKYLHEGIYKANAVGGTWGEGQFGIGYDTTIKYWGWNQEKMQMDSLLYEAKDWGTVLWTVKDGAATADHKILDGIVVVRRTDTGWQISWGKEYPTEYVFEGAIEALTEPEASDKVEPVLEKTSGLTYTAVDETATNTNASNEPLSGVTLWRVSVKDGNNLVAAFDFVVTAGEESFVGTYEVMAYPDAVGKAGNGFVIPGVFGCGCYYLVEDSCFLIPVGATVTVTENTDKSLKFEFAGDVLDPSFEPAGEGSLVLDNVAKAS